MNADDTLATRASLLGRLRNRDDQTSWQEFFDTYWRLIYNVARQAGLNDAEAQDVVQETVIAVANQIGAFRYDPQICSFKTWMLRLTRWRILDRLRRRGQEAAKLGRRVHRHRAPSEEATEDLTAQTATLEGLPDPAGVNLASVWEVEWRQALFHAALESLRLQVSPDQYQIFDLYVVKQMPARQVARLAGVSMASVYLAKHRMAARLKREIQRLEAALPGQHPEPG